MKHWLVKTEPSTYSIEDLKKDRKTAWDGVRNYQARNFMRDGMEKGDLVLFYHSNCDVPGVYGVARVASNAYPDPTQFDPKSKYHDPKATKDRPRWQLVDLAYVKRFRAPVSLEAMRGEKRLSKMTILRPGNRLSVTPVTEKEFEAVADMAGTA